MTKRRGLSHLLCRLVFGEPKSRQYGSTATNPDAQSLPREEKRELRQTLEALRRRKERKIR